MPRSSLRPLLASLPLLPATVASAAFTFAEVRTVGTGLGPERAWTQFEVVAHFDAPGDVLSSVGGFAGLQPLRFETDDCAGLVNTPNLQGPFGAELWNPFVIPSADSYLAMGVEPNVFFSAGFLDMIRGDADGHIAGTNWSVDDGGYFVPGGVSVGVGEIVIANFVVRDGYHVSFSGRLSVGGAGLVPFAASNLPIAPPLAPCCLPDGGCTALFECACLEAGGTWNGGFGLKVFCGDLPDCNENGTPDVCDAPPPCPGDLDGDGNVGFTDLSALLADWGPCPCCPGDVTADEQVGFADLDALLAQWGACSG